MTRFTPQQEAEYREVMAAKAAREHAEDIALISGLPRATIAKAVAALLTVVKLPARRPT